MPEQEPVAAQQMPPEIPNGKSGKITKIAIMAFVVVLIIVISELGYLTLNKNSSFDYKTFLSSLIPSKQKQNSDVTPIPQLYTDKVLTKVTINPGVARDYADFLDSFGDQSTFLVQATMDMILKGTVVSTDSNGSPLPFVVVLSDNEGRTLTLSFTKGEIDDAQIYLVKNGNISQIPFGDITPNDILTVKRTRNVLSDSDDSLLVFQIERQ
jgi:hypothetical protein